MRYSLRGFLALKRPVLFSALFVWVAGLSLSAVLEGPRRSHADPEPRWIAVSVMALTTVFAVLIMASPRVRARLIAESKAKLYEPAPFFLFAAVTATLIFIELFG